MVGQFEGVVPIAADLGFLAGGAVGAVELAARNAREAGGQQRALKPIGDLVLPLEERGLVERVGDLQAEYLGDFSRRLVKASGLARCQRERAGGALPPRQRNDQDVRKAAGA